MESGGAHPPNKTYSTSSIATAGEVIGPARCAFVGDNVKGGQVTDEMDTMAAEPAWFGYSPGDHGTQNF